MMNKYTMMAAMVFCSPVAMAQTGVSTDTQKAESAINELCDLQVKIVELLESAKDKESADAAAEELFMVIGRVQELQADASKIRNCDAATQQRLVGKLIRVTVSVDARKKAAGSSLVKNDFYGSEDLKSALRLML